MSSKKTSPGAGWKTQDVHFKQRYEDGYRYLDKCGEFLIEAEKEYGFVCSEVVPTGARIEIPEYGISASVDTKEIKATQEVPDDECNQFLPACSGLVKLVARFFSPSRICSNGISFRSCWALETPEDSLNASLSVNPEFSKDLAKKLGMAPSHQNVNMHFSSGSKELTVEVVPITLERINVQRHNAPFHATVRQKRLAERRNKKSARLSDLPSAYALSLNVDLVEFDPPETDLSRHFEMLKKYRDRLRQEFTA